MKFPSISTRRFATTLLQQFEQSPNKQLISEFLDTVEHYNEILEQVNPACNMTEKERIERSAHRVGLQLPKTVTVTATEGQE